MLRMGRRTLNRLRRTLNMLRNFEHFIISMGYNIVHQKFKVLFINSYRRSFHTNKIYNNKSSLYYNQENIDWSR